MKIIVILTLSISLFSYSFTRIDAVNAGENEVGTVDYEALAHRSEELDPVKTPDEVIALLEPHRHGKDKAVSTDDDKLPPAPSDIQTRE